jgi:cytochrome c-type biogenesis protein
MLGIDLWDAGLIPAMFVALLGGLISFVSPCVLPIVPPYLAYMGGVSMDDMSATAQARRRVVLAALFFVLGLSTVFILLGFTASSFGRLFLSNQDWFVSGAGILVMVFGAHFLGVIRIGLLDREARIAGGDRGGLGLWGLYFGAGLCLWLDALSGAHFGHNPRACRRYCQSLQKGSSCSPHMRRAWVFPSCWWRCSFRLLQG